jgi:hypothetical protein
LPLPWPPWSSGDAVGVAESSEPPPPLVPPWSSGDAVGLAVGLAVGRAVARAVGVAEPLPPWSSGDAVGLAVAFDVAAAVGVAESSEPPLLPPWSSGDAVGAAAPAAPLPPLSSVAVGDGVVNAAWLLSFRFSVSRASATPPKRSTPAPTTINVVVRFRPVISRTSFLVCAGADRHSMAVRPDQTLPSRHIAHHRPRFRTHSDLGLMPHRTPVRFPGEDPLLQ